jgi:2-polyprenyl-3-methyl-5-hydroxy-6-metoxy-1,4-benzoquinol methylase
MFLNVILIFSSLVAGEIENTFNTIYKEALWGRNSEGEGFSGSGSNVENCSLYSKFIEDFIQQNNIESVLDVGCGDWTFSQYMNWGAARYTGIDIVRSVIEKNQIKFSKPKINFFHWDDNFTDLPEADLMICKDVLQHLPIESIQLLLKQVGKYKYCLITNDINTYGTNQPIKAGDYRDIDLKQAPFHIKGTKILTFPSGLVTKQIFYIQNSI